MHPEPESTPSPRLERLLRARADRPARAGMPDRVFRASVGLLPEGERAPAVLARMSWRWLAAAAALLLAVGASMRIGAQRAVDDSPCASLAVVLEVSDAADQADDFASLKAVHGARFADLDDEMNMLLADGRVGR